MVRNILSNPTYAGHLTQNRCRRLGPKLPQKQALPQEEWITVEGTHPALVSQEEFEQAQQLLEKRSYRRAGHPPHLLSGLAFCAQCGAAMTYVRESPQRTYMVCQGYRRGGKETCTPHRIREDEALDMLGQALRRFTQENLDTASLLQAVTSRVSHGDKDRQERDIRLERNHRMRRQLYRDTADGRLRQEDHCRLLAELDAERESLLAEPDLPAVDHRARLEELLSFQPPHRALLTALVERVSVHEGKRVEVFLTTGVSEKDLDF